MSFPTKDQREACWSARDRFWECLNQHKTGKDMINSHPECEELRKVYVNNCPAQWVKHFDRKRSYLQFKERIEKEGISSRSNESIIRKHRVYRELV